MKHFNYLFIALLLSLAGIPVHAEIINEEDHFFCGFDTEEEYKQWKVIDINGPASNGNSVFWWEGEGSAYINTSYNLGTDDCILTPAIKISGTKKYALKMKVTTIADSIQIAMGKDDTMEAQTIIVAKREKYEGNNYLKFSLPENIEAGTYFFSIHVKADPYQGQFHLFSFELTEDINGSLNVTTQNEKTQELLKDVEISLIGTAGTYYEGLTYYSNEEGKCAYGNLNPGVYTVNATIDGFYPIEKQEVTVNEGENNLVLDIKPIPLSVVSGKLVDEANQPIEGAKITLRGEKIYEGTSDNEGKFSIKDVRHSENKYVLTIKKDLKVTHTAEVLINQETTDLGEIILKDFIGTPASLTTDYTEKGMFLSWMMPLGEKEFFYDNGEFAGRSVQNAPYASVGVLFNEPMIVNEMSWVTADIKDEMVDVYVYLLNKDGSIASTPIYEKKQVPTKNYDYEILEWNVYKFPEPIVAPYGCIVGLGHAESMSICMDYQNNNWTSMISHGNGWGSSNYSNFFIRANGISLSSDLSTPNPAQNIRLMSKPVVKKSPAKAMANQRFSFKVWRLEAKDKENQEAWKELSSGLKELYLIDKEYDKLTPGSYLYAVQANYITGQSSDICFSKEVEHRLHTTVTAEIFTNTIIDFAQGTTITLTNMENESYVYTATAEGKTVTFNNVRKGKYMMTASREGFQTAQSEADLSEGDSYKARVELQLAPIAPFGLKTIQAEESADITLSWNEATGIFDDFEGMEDFSVNPAGELGWTYADVDGGKTFGVKQCENTPYPNMFEPMAFMAFNPTATTPNLLELVQPHSGNKMMISIGLETGGANDDYMFSPELKFENNFIMSFYACSGFYAAMGNEKFMVGYTTDEAKPENVIWLTEEPVEVGALWTKFSYRMPQEARHTVIRCVSNQNMFFMVDDVFIGREEPDVFAMATYNVTVDEEPVGTTTGKSIVLEGLSEGKHIAKVQTVYTMNDLSKQYSDFTELIFTVKEAVGMDSKEASVLYTYNAETGIVTLGDTAEKAELYNVQGNLCATCMTGETIDTQALQTGVYVLKIQAESETSFGKILVK